MKKIKVAEPTLAGNERTYAMQCFDEGWISSNGRFISQFETAFASYNDVSHAISTNNGTTGLHLALLAMNLKPGQEVLIPTLTYIATANAVSYCGAIPVLVDCEPGTMNIDPRDLESKITSKTVGIIPVHLYGHPADMVSVMQIARKNNLWVVEDAAEAHGSTINGRKVGTFGDCAIFSFFGNKIVTTGEGGMITTNSDSIADRAKLLRSQGMDPQRRYWFPEIGFNYRMTNIQAAIGVAQLEQIESFLEKRRWIANHYDSGFSDLGEYLWVPIEKEGVKHSYWMYTINLLQSNEAGRDFVMQYLDLKGIETRPVFYPMHRMPPYFNNRISFQTADKWSTTGINLPTHANLDADDLDYVIENVKNALGELRKMSKN